MSEVLVRLKYRTYDFKNKLMYLKINASLT